MNFKYEYRIKCTTCGEIMISLGYDFTKKYQCPDCISAELSTERRQDG